MSKDVAYFPELCIYIIKAVFRSVSVWRQPLVIVTASQGAEKEVNECDQTYNELPFQRWPLL